MEAISAATKIQAAFRGYATRQDLKTKNTAATTIQKNYRGHKTRKEIEEQDQSARVIQRNYRSYQEQKDDRPWWKRFCDKCNKVSKKIFRHKDKPHGRSPTSEKEEDEYKPSLKNPYDENPVEVEEYNVPEGKTLTLLQLSKIYDKKQDHNIEEDIPLKTQPPKLVPGMAAVESETGAYQQPKQHKVIKYHALTPPDSPERKQEETTKVDDAATEEEGNFFTRLFKPLEIKSEDSKPEDKKPVEDSEDNVFGKFKGLFTRDEKPKEPDCVPLVTENEESKGQGNEGNDEGSEKEAQPQSPPEEKVDVLARFQNRFKKEYNIAPQKEQDSTDSAAEPKQETEEEGAFSKFTGLFKTENKDNTDTSNTNKDEGNFASKFTGLFKKDEDVTSKDVDSSNVENNGNIVKKDNQEEAGFFGKLFKKDEEKPAEQTTDKPSEESGIDKMFSIFKKN